MTIVGPEDYMPPIIINEIIDKAKYDIDKEIMEVVYKTGIEVNKEALIEALEKQKPKKPILTEADEYGIVDHLCPTCGEPLISKYCYECGQRIDWSAEPDKESEEEQ